MLQHDENRWVPVGVQILVYPRGRPVCYNEGTRITRSRCDVSD